MRVTSKGQVTIPQDVRRRLGIEPGSEVDFEVDDDAVRLVRRTECGGAALVARMRGRRLTMSTDEIMALTRGDDS
ncbi:MAG TPA: AbrB/MazE/SpoVT family DNA-binding domain-containing protein [Aldersonia sp.]|jgi:AbrB family looped-hinge helix DNA binding protein